MRNSAKGSAVRKYARVIGRDSADISKKLPGTPDIAFMKSKIVVFVDGDYWHGWKFAEWKHKLKPYWREKIQRNQERDRLRTAQLAAEGWLVIRLWEHELKEDLDTCADAVEAAVRRAVVTP